MGGIIERAGGMLRCEFTVGMFDGVVNLMLYWRIRWIYQCCGMDPLHVLAFAFSVGVGVSRVFLWIGFSGRKER